jgi:hypothetical protein
MGLSIADAVEFALDVAEWLAERTESNIDNTAIQALRSIQGSLVGWIESLLGLGVPPGAVGACSPPEEALAAIGDGAIREMIRNLLPTLLPIILKYLAKT